MTDAADAAPSATLPSPASGRERTLGLIAAIAAISVAGLGFGHSIPLFSVLLERAGASGLVNGTAAAAGALAVIVATPFYPRLIGRVGLKAVLAGGRSGHGAELRRDLRRARARLGLVPVALPVLGGRVGDVRGVRGLDQRRGHQGDARAADRALLDLLSAGLRDRDR